MLNNNTCTKTRERLTTGTAPAVKMARNRGQIKYEPANMKPLFCSLLLALTIFLPAGADAQSNLPDDSDVKMARLLILNERFDDALRILLSIGLEQPNKVDVLFLTGLAAIGAAETRKDDTEREAFLDVAIATLRSLLIDRPELERVRLELARALFLKEEDILAKQHFEQVLSGTLPASVASSIDSYLRSIRARRRWEARFGLSVIPDNNLNAASGTRTIWLDTFFGRLPFTREGNIAPKSGLGASIWGGSEYEHPLSPRWRLRAGADVSLREYKGGDFDTQFVASHLGPRWLIDPRTDASVLATVQRHWNNGRPETDQYGLRLEVRHRLLSRLSFSGSASLERRVCRTCDWLHGPIGNASLGANWVALSTLRIGGDVGWSRRRAKEEAWRSAGPHLSLHATLLLSKGFTLGARASAQWIDYEGTGVAHYTIDRRPREDLARSLSLSVHNRALTFFGFSPRVSLVNEKRKTNAQLLAYERYRGELSFVRQF